MYAAAFVTLAGQAFPQAGQPAFAADWQGAQGRSLVAGLPTGSGQGQIHLHGSPAAAPGSP